MLYPERRFYPANQESGTMVAIYSTLKEDLYVVYAGRSPDTQPAGDSRVSESAGEMDLAGRRDCRAGHVAGHGAQSASRCWRCAPWSILRAPLPRFRPRALPRSATMAMIDVGKAMMSFPAVPSRGRREFCLSLSAFFLAVALTFAVAPSFALPAPQMSMPPVEPASSALPAGRARDIANRSCACAAAAIPPDRAAIPAPRFPAPAK